MEDRHHLNEPAATEKPKIILPGDEPEKTSEPVPVPSEQGEAIVVERIVSTSDVRSVAQTGTFILLIFYTLYFARAVLLPITLALLLNFLLRPIIQRLEKWHIPPALSATVVLLLFITILAGAVYGLSWPAQAWLRRAPTMMSQVGEKVQRMSLPFQKVRRAASQVGTMAQGGQEGQAKAPQVQVHKSILDTGLFTSSTEFIGNFVVVVILLFFMLSSGDFFLHKLIQVLPTLSDRKRALKIANETESEISRYFVTVTIINACLGVAVGTALYFIGMPTPYLWGAAAFVLNFIPYLGALTGIVLTALVALISFDSIGHALLAPGAYLLIAVIEGNFVTPTVMGRTFTLNTVVIFIWLVFLGWLWGVPGALIAVPILAVFKIFCDHIDRLHNLGEFLGNTRN